MSKELFVTSTPHETKLAIVEDDQLVEVYFERENEYTLAGSIYKGRVTRVLPGMQSAFVDVGLERDAFLYVTDFLEEVEDSEEFEPVSQPAPPRRDHTRHTNDHRSFTPPQPQPSAMQIEGDFTGEAPDVEAQAAPEIEPGNAAEPSSEKPDQGDRGSRRWRGRRGRRRGRGTAFSESKFAHPEQKGSETQADGSENEEDQLEVRAESFDENNEPAGAEQEAGVGQDPTREEHGGSGHRQAGPLGPEGAENLPRQQQPRRERQQRDDRERRPQREVRAEGRSGREDRPAREDRQQREDRSQRNARPEPVILPGESLAKFNRKSEPAPSQQQAGGSTESQQESRFQLAARRPSTEVREPATLVSASHGILAGESLAKYRQKTSEGSQAASAAPAHERDVREEKHAESEQHQQHATSPISEERHQQPVEERHRKERPQEEERLQEEDQETHEHQRTESSPTSSDSDAQPAQGTGDYNFRPGSGVLEEEEVTEEEHDSTGLGFDAVEDEYEELEEETLQSDIPEHREEKVIAAGEGLASAFAEEKTQANQYMEEDVANEEEEEKNGGEENLAGDRESELEQAHAAAEFDHESGDAVGDAVVVDPDDPNFAGRAELRAPAGTAGYQMKTERAGFDPRRRDRKGRGRPPMRRGGGPRRNIPRGPMPQINELLKEGQEILVQIAKEPMAKKGARITSHIALPGRFLVFMPTVNHTGVSRKIGSEEERQRLKRILLSEKGQGHGGFIVRTAASGASEDDLRADIRFLINLWNEIKQRSETSKAPALIYHDLNLVERILRDQVTSTFSNIWVDNEQEYERIVKFTSRFQSSLVKRVKLYSKDTPLFEQFNIQEEINKALKSKVWLKSGGYIVINQTEALVAIDINTGKYVGKTARLEDTIVKTNIDAIKEIVRQIRLRDLGGIIVIDFIDMDERRNRQKVMQALEEALRSDRSPSKVLQFNDFGLVAITRKRVKQSLERTLGTQCVYCTGTGMIKSVATVCNEIYVELRKMAKHFENQQVMLRVNPEVAKALKDNGGKRLSEMEEMLHRTIIVKSDATQHQEQFDIN